jgi:hypothetical protein
MKLKKRYWIPIAFIAMIATVYALLVESKCRAGVDVLTSPVTVTEVAPLPDGGSVTITLHSIDGRKLTLRRIGSLSVAAELQEMRSVSWFGFIPVSCNAPKGSRLEQEARQVLKTWLADKLTAQQQSALMQGDQEAMKTIPYTVAGVYDLAAWIDRRK